MTLMAVAVLALPPGFRVGLWSAPLESGTAFLALLGILTAMWYAARTLNRRPARAEMALLLILAVLKAVAWYALPSSGIWARIVPPDPVQAAAVAKEALSPIRPHDDNGFFRYRSLRAPADFINDHTRYDSATPGNADRLAYPADVRIRFWLLADRTMTLAAPAGAIVTGGLQSAGADSAQSMVRYRAPIAKLLPVEIATSSTAGFSQPYLMLEENCSLKPVEDWRIWPDHSQVAPFTARPYFLAGRCWNSLFCLFAILLWWRNATLTDGDSRHRLRFCTAALLLIACGIAPISRQDLGLRLALLLPVAAAFMVCLWRLRSDLRLTKAHIYLQLAVLLGWSALGIRFILDRFPGGHVVIPGGMDSLFHYKFAMQVLHDDWLHQADAPFTRQPFLRWLLTIPILLFGEGPGWGIACNWLLAGVLGFQLSSAVRPYGERRALLLYLLWFPFIAVSAFRLWIPTLFPEVSSLVFLMASLLMLQSALNAAGSSGKLIVAGIWFGLALWTRNNLLLAAPCWVLAIFLRSPSGRVAALRASFAFCAVVAGMVLIVTIRNKVAAPESPVSLLLRPDMSALALFQGFPDPEAPYAGQDPATNPDYARIFLSAVREQPVLFLKFQADRISALLGGPAFWEPNLVSHYPRWNPLHLLIWGAILVRLIRSGWRGMSGFTQLLCWGLLVSQILLLFFTGYVGSGYRFVAPLYPFMLLLVFLPPANAGAIRHIGRQTT